MAGLGGKIICYCNSLGTKCSKYSKLYLACTTEIERKGIGWLKIKPEMYRGCGKKNSIIDCVSERNSNAS